uniref:Protein kinase domain-containing protein n=1 Tax=Kalanchoe fedtschenkoi TaxID=63787 RepID=A0A7N0VKC4_KALFE
MEDRRANILAVSLLTALTTFIIICRVYLRLNKPFFLLLGASVAACLAVLAWISFRHRFNRRRKLLETKLVSEGRELRIEYSFLRKIAGVPTKFRQSELEDATDKFQSLIGQGASGSVFKGILSDGTPVAVKRINNGEERGDKEFRSEVSAIASVQHINLVRLLGYCVVQGGPKFLVYDFISNGSLANWIFPKSESSNRRCGGCLAWYLRYRVALDVAKALSYLHQDCRSRILHLDVKPENILLDDNFQAVVSDFGLSKLMGRDESRIITSMRGTRGYLAPEWLLENGVSEKSDIYSYGMVLLELVGGRRNVRLVKTENAGKSKTKWEYFPKIVNEKMKEGRLMEIVDPRLMEGGGVDEREVQKLVHVALWCTQERTGLRPSMNMVVDMLGGRAPVEEPPESPMIIVDLLGIDDEESDGSRARFCGVAPSQLSDRRIPSISSYSFSNAMSILSGR